MQTSAVPMEAPPEHPAQPASAATALWDWDTLLTQSTPADIWNTMLMVAVRERGSDIHFSFQEQNLYVAARVDGRLSPQGQLPAAEGQRLINHIKVAAGIDPAEKRRPQEGHLACTIDDHLIDLRVSILPTSQGESVAIRIQDRDAALLGLDELGLSARQQDAVAALIAAPSGLVLVTGATGSGKTTTLYAILRQLADGSRKIISIENPVEYDLPGIDQSQVNYKLGLDFATLMRAGLRHDPNVIMIGEVRDAETAEAVVRAANSGRLVFATTHAANAASAVGTLISLGAHPHFVARSFRGAIAQTLVRRLCPYCATPLVETMDCAMVADIRHLLAPHERPILSLGRGCPHCRHTGYRGRRGIFEVLVADQHIRTLVEQQAPDSAITDAARAARMTTLEEAGKLAAVRGLTTAEELVQNVAEIWGH